MTYCTLTHTHRFFRNKILSYSAMYRTVTSYQLGVMADSKGIMEWVLEKGTFHNPTLISLSFIEIRAIVNIHGLYIYPEEKP